jgi:hypothetical protein
LAPASTSRRARATTDCGESCSALRASRKAVFADSSFFSMALNSPRKDVSASTSLPASVPMMSTCFCTLSRNHKRSTTRSMAISVLGEANTMRLSKASVCRSWLKASALASAPSIGTNRMVMSSALGPSRRG